MQAASKKSSFKCPAFTVPSKGKEPLNETNTEEDFEQQSLKDLQDGGLDVKSVNSGEARLGGGKEKEDEQERPEYLKAGNHMKDVKPSKRQKKAVKKKPVFQVKQKDGDVVKEVKEKKVKVKKRNSENETESKEAQDFDKSEKPKEDKKVKRTALPVRSLADEEYEAIFAAAIESVMAINMEEWQPKPTSPPVLKKRKKYSITVGRKPDSKNSQSPQESDHEEESTGDEKNMIDKDCDNVAGTEGNSDIYDTLDEKNEEGRNNKNAGTDVNDNIHNPSAAAGEDDRIVDENNNDVAIEDEQDEQESVQNNESIDIVQHQNEKTPDGSELDFGDTPSHVHAPACASPPAKKKKKGVRKNQKLEPKSLSFTEKEENVSEAEVVLEDDTKKKLSETVQKDKVQNSAVQKELTTKQPLANRGNQQDQVPIAQKTGEENTGEKKTSKTTIAKPKKAEKSATQKEQKSERPSMNKEKLKETPVKEKIKKLKQMVKELELPKKKRKLGENIDLKKQKQEKKGIKNRHRVEKETKPRTKESKKSLMLKRKVANEGTWVQCCNAGCLKWRHLPDISDPSKVPERWVCKMNTREEYNSCDKPEETYDESDHIYTQFTEGSVVWAKLSGWPWWPAMVEIDPDAETYFDTNEAHSMIPTHYHVVFFDERVSRAWVRADSLRLFTGSAEADNIRMFQLGKKGQPYMKEINVAKKNAMEALQYSMQERIELFGFATRYHGKWGNITDSCKSTKSEKKRKVTCRDSKKIKPHHLSTDMLDDDEIESVINNTESLLDDVEEVLGSLDSELDDSDEDSEFNPVEVLPKKRREFVDLDVSAHFAKKSRGLLLDCENNSESESEKAELVSVQEDNDAESDTLKLDSETEIKHEKDHVSQRNEIGSQLKTDSDGQKSKSKIMLDPEVFTMEEDEVKIDIAAQGDKDRQRINGERNTENSKGKSKKLKTTDAVRKANKESKSTTSEKNITKSKGKPKEFKAPLATKSNKKVVTASATMEKTEITTDYYEKDKANKVNILKEDGPERYHDPDKYDRKVTVESDENDADQNEPDMYDKLDPEEIALGEQNQKKIDKSKHDSEKETETDEELDLAPEVPDINSQEEASKKEQKWDDYREDSEDDFDLVEKSMYDSDPVLEKVHDMEVVDNTVVHSQDSDSDPFDMMIEE